MSASVGVSVSVVIVSDYASGKHSGWNDLRVMLAALSRQDYQGNAEYLLIESSEFESCLPSDLRNILPSLKIHFVDSSSSYALKNRGAELATADIVGVLDGDCAPAPGWLTALARTIATHPTTAVVSGRTVYNSDTMTERLLGLLSRGYLDTGMPGETDGIANNNCGFTRKALLAHPFLDDVGAFGGKLQAESMRQSGLEFRFEPGMLASHHYEGWAMERDIRRQSGYATVMVRRIDPRIEFSWLPRLGAICIPLLYFARLLLSWKNLVCLHKHYELPWWTVPHGLVLAIYLHWLEIPGMRLALSGRKIADTAYR